MCNDKRDVRLNKFSLYFSYTRSLRGDAQFTYHAQYNTVERGKPLSVDYSDHI